MTCYSPDLRHKVVQLYLQKNTSIRALAQQFQISTSTVQRYLKQDRQTGDLTPRKPGSKRKSVLSQPETVALAVVADHPDWTLWPYCDSLTEKLGINVSTSMMDRFCKEQGTSINCLVAN